MLQARLSLFALLVTLPALAAPADKLQDSFGGTSIDRTLWNVSQNLGTATESGGTLNLVPNGYRGGTSIAVSSIATWSLKGSQAAVKAARVPSSVGHVDAQYSLLLDGKNYLQWFYQGGVLYAFSSKGGSR